MVMSYSERTFFLGINKDFVLSFGLFAGFAFFCGGPAGLTSAPEPPAALSAGSVRFFEALALSAGGADGMGGMEKPSGAEGVVEP